MPRLTLAEVPVTLRPDGRSRPPHLRSWRDGWRHLRFMLLFSPRWLFLVPGLTLALVSLAAFLRLMAGPVRLGGVTFDVNTLILASAGLVAGVQTVLLGHARQGRSPSIRASPRRPRCSRGCSGCGRSSSASSAAACCCWSAWPMLLLAVERWREAGFGELPYPRQRAGRGAGGHAGGAGHPARLQRVRPGDPRVRPRDPAQACPVLSPLAARRRAARSPSCWSARSCCPGRRLLNWHPYLFWDTYGYFLQGKAYAQLLLGWAGLGPPPPEAAAGLDRRRRPDAGARPVDPLADLEPLSYGLAAGGGFWLLALLNALVAAATVELFLARLLGRAAARGGSRSWPAWRC